MSGAKVSSIRSSLGPLQHLRETPDTRIPAAYPDTRTSDPAPAVSGHKVGKRSDPRYCQLKAYVLKTSKKAAMKKAEAEGYAEFSDLVQKWLDDYLSR